MSDLIRREDALAILDLAEHDAEERDWRSGANEIARLIQRVRSIPAALSDHPAVKALVADAEARGMELAAVIAERHLSKVEINEPLWHEGQDWAAESIALAVRAEAALTKIARLGQDFDAAKHLTEYERKVAQMRKDFPNGI